MQAGKMVSDITYIRVGDQVKLLDHGHGPCRQKDSGLGIERGYDRPKHRKKACVGCIVD